jgi:ubiquinone/menaquinone biosynthesis C-methylase UbiE
MSELSAEKQNAFTQKMIDILNGGALNLAVAIGYRTGLFDIMERFDTPQPISVLSEHSGLNARYIREWLGIMITGGIVEVIRDEENRENKYVLPKEHAAILTRSSGNRNLAVYAQEIPLLTITALDPVIHGFQTGDGVPYSCYPKFQAFMTELADAKHREVLVDKFLPGVDDGTLISRLNAGIRVCDLGCGEGVAPLLMAEAFPKSTFVGMDISEDVIKIAQKKAENMGLKNIRFMIRDAALLKDDPEFEGYFDYITAFDSIHDQTAPLLALQGIRHMLAPGGIFSMIDIAAKTEQAENISHPMGPFLYTVSLMHCMPVGLADGGTGLGMMWGQEKAADMLKQAGFEKVEVLEMTHDTFNLHYLCRKL